MVAADPKLDFSGVFICNELFINLTDSLLITILVPAIIPQWAWQYQLYHAPLQVC